MTATHQKTIYNFMMSKDSVEDNSELIRKKRKAVLLGKRRYDNLSEDKLRMEREKRAGNARRWRQKKKDEMNEMKRKIEELECELNASIAERNRSILYTLPGVGCHQNVCQLCQTIGDHTLYENSSIGPKPGPNLSCIIPLQEMARIDLAIASHLLPLSTDKIVFHQKSVVTVEVYYGEAILFYENLVHRGGESDSTCLRSFVTFSESCNDILLDNRNYIGVVKECNLDCCPNCEQINRLEKERDGEILSMRRVSRLGIGSSVLNSVNLKEYGFVVVKLLDDEHVNEKLVCEIVIVNKYQEGSRTMSHFHSINQEEHNLEKEGKKRMILKKMEVMSTRTNISNVYPNISLFIEKACTVLTSFLLKTFSIRFSANDFTLLKNGDEGSGKQLMHLDSTSVCNCFKHIIV